MADARCLWPLCCGDPDEGDFCGGCSREVFEAERERFESQRERLVRDYGMPVDLYVGCLHDDREVHHHEPCALGRPRFITERAGPSQKALSACGQPEPAQAPNGRAEDL